MITVKKHHRDTGFTLAELLIVVAIIAVLVAVAVPTFNNQLERSRQSTDLSNLRGAYAAAKIAELNGEVAAYTANGTADHNIKIGPPRTYEDQDLANQYAGVTYAFWYDADTGRLYPAGNLQGAAEIVKIDTASANTYIRTRLNARSTKIAVDTSNLPGGASGIIQYADVEGYGRTDISEAEDSDLPGSDSATWRNRRILVVFFPEDGLWVLKQSSVRFADILTTEYADVNDNANGYRVPPVSGAETYPDASSFD